MDAEPGQHGGRQSTMHADLPGAHMAQTGLVAVNFALRRARHDITTCAEGSGCCLQSEELDSRGACMAQNILAHTELNHVGSLHAAAAAGSRA